MNQSSKDALLIAGLLGGSVLALTFLHNTLARKPLPSSPPAPVPFPIRPIVFFPDLSIGDRVIVQPTLANMPEPLRSQPTIVATVDLVLTDKSLISVKVTSPSVFSGTIPRTAILSILPKGIVV